jgi:hypothetical protein
MTQSSWTLGPEASLLNRETRYGNRDLLSDAFLVRARPNSEMQLPAFCKMIKLPEKHAKRVDLSYLGLRFV